MDFVGLLASAVATPATALQGRTTSALAARSLILSGGGALGAYEAGAVAALAAAARLSDGEPLPQYGVIAGTSIGAFNAYLAATAQWSQLTRLWSTIASTGAVRFKPEFSDLANRESGVGNRLAEALRLGLGAGKNVTGIYDGDHLRAFLTSFIDRSKPIVTPLFWAVTNITTESPEYFFAVPPGYDSQTLATARDALLLTLGPFVAVRESSPDVLIDQLRASAAVPAAFDPVPLRAQDGSVQFYADGGVTANTPVSIGRALSGGIDAILLAPPYKQTQYHNIIDVLLGSYDTMQRRLMADALRAAATESLLFRLVRTMPTAQVDAIANRVGFDPPELRTLAEALSHGEFKVLQPAAPLPAALLGFNDQKGIGQTFQIGWNDGLRGFQRFEPRRFI